MQTLADKEKVALQDRWPLKGGLEWPCKTGDLSKEV